MGGRPLVWLSALANLLIIGRTEDESPANLFGTENCTVVRAQIRSNAILPCALKEPSDAVTVSWIRRKDYHLLTVGMQTYSSDDRFLAIHAAGPEDWGLKIRFVQKRDAGLYECQISSHPPSSLLIELVVVEAVARIVGSPEIYVKAGSPLTLHCDLHQSFEAPEFWFWYQGLKMISFEGGVNVSSGADHSRLTIPKVGKGEAGNYTCQPSNAEGANVFVHILNGENPAAMQHGSPSTGVVGIRCGWTLAAAWLLRLALSTQ